MYFIQETDKPNLLLNLFNIVKFQNNNIILPISYDGFCEKNIEKMAKKTVKKLNETNSKKVILSKKLKKEEIYINYLYTMGYEIIDGIWLFEIIADKVLDYILEKKKLNKNNIRLSILVNDLSEFEISIIKNLIKQYKKVNIVTNHIEKFKNIENKILENDGISIAITNNKRKSIAKSDLILNMDFPTELLNKYNIFEEAIIVNIKSKCRIEEKRFNGLNINDYEIEFEKREEFTEFENSKFWNKDIYEAHIYQRQPYENIYRKINSDKVRVKFLKAINVTF